MVSEALDDAGLTLDDVDGGVPCGPVHLHGHVSRPGRVHWAFTRSSPSRPMSAVPATRFIWSMPPRRWPSASAMWWCASTRRHPAATTSAASTPTCLRGSATTPEAEWEAPYGLWQPMGPYALGRQPAHGPVRDDFRAAGPDRGQHPPVGRVESEGPLPDSDHGGRCCRLTGAPVAAASSRLLPGDRRSRRVRADQRGAGPPTCASLRCTCWARQAAMTTT